MSDIAPGDDTYERTLDLALIANIARGDRVAVERVSDSTQEMFDQTLALVGKETDHAPAAERPPFNAATRAGFTPENKDLRSIYLLAEAVGGYEAFHDIVNVHSPGKALSDRYREKAQVMALSEAEVRGLREYQAQIQVALKSANAYLRETAVNEFSREEMHDLHEVILTASDRSKELNRIMGTHLMHEIELAVARLHEYHNMIRAVEQSVDGIFLVDSEVMFIPGNELVKCVNTLFEGVGNSYLSRNIDGVLLLAARNLLIDVASFYSFYGRHQIYNVLKKGGANVSTQAIAGRIRREIRRLFDACKRDNKLVLTRIMSDAERNFDLSVEAIQTEAEHSAMEVVIRLIPPEHPVMPVARKKGIFRRILGWFGG